MLIQGALREGDYVDAQFLHLRAAKSNIWVGILWLAFGIGAVIYDSSYFLFVVLIFLAIIVTMTITIPYMAKRTFRQYKALSEHLTIETRDAGLFFKSANGEVIIPWSHILKWHKSKRLILIYPASNVFHMIPNHFFANQAEFNTFAELINSKYTT